MDDPFASRNEEEIRQLVQACSLNIVYPALRARAEAALEASRRVRALEHLLSCRHQEYLASIPGMACHVSPPPR